MRAAQGCPVDTSVIYKALLVMLAGFMICLMLRAGQGEREFRESQKALRQVTSWQQEMRVGSENKEHAEIACPDGAQTGYVQTQTSDEPKGVQKGSEQSQHTAMAVAECEKLRRDGHDYPLPDYEQLIMHTKISKGAVETVQGMECQEWTSYRVISGRFAPAQPLDNTQICIGLHDHLPRRIKYEDAEYIFYDWHTDDRKKSSAVGIVP